MRLIQTNLSLRDRCAHRSWQSASPNAARKHTATAKRNGFPRRFAQRDGGIPRFINLPPVPLGGMTHVFYPLLFLFPIGNFRTLATPQALCASSPRRGAKSSLFPTGAFSTPATPQSASLTAPLKGAQGRGAAVQQGKFSPPLHYLKGATRGAAKTSHHIVKIHRNHKKPPRRDPVGAAALLAYCL